MYEKLQLRKFSIVSKALSKKQKKIRKLICNLGYNEKYVIHIRNLNHRLKLEKSNRAIKSS